MDKEEIRDRTDIVEVVGSSVALHRRGRSYQGLCPFHTEKTPSFHVDPVYKTFKCFGCGVGGDVFTFVERYHNMDFPEAAEFLARRLGGTFDRRGGPAAQEATSERERIYALNALAAEFYRKSLDRATAAREYVLGRGIAHETIQQFKIGFAPDDWTALVGYLHREREDLKLAATAGLVRLGQTGDYLDMFRGRVVFPILDEQERVVGFGGRAMGDEQPKYLNTGETPVFAKSKLLYGLPYARRKIASEGKTLLMEGYMDVIAAHQAGFTNAVATLGTSLTEEHAKRLARLAPTVVLVYDADSAGIKATLRASEILEKESVQVKVVRLPAGDDPDSLLKRGEIAAFQKTIDDAVGRVSYQLERIVAGADQTTDAGKQDLLKKIVAILASVPSRSERDIYVNQMWRYHPMSASNPGVAIEQLHRDAEASAARRSAPRRGETAPQQAVPPPATLTAEMRAERELIRALGEGEWRSTVLECAPSGFFSSELGSRFRCFVEEHLDDLNAGDGNLVALLDRFESEEFSLQVRQELQEINALMVKVPVTEASIRGCAETLRKYRIRQLKREQAQFLQSKAELSDDDRERVAEYQKMLVELQGS